MIEDIVGDRMDLLQEALVVEGVCEGNETIEPVGETFVERGVFRGSAEPGGFSDEVVEVVLVACETVGGEGELVAEPARGADGS